MKVPCLIGSKKQSEWASQIRCELTSEVRKKIDLMRERNYDDDDYYANSAEKAWKRILEEKRDAKWWIDRRYADTNVIIMNELNS